ncbi:MAG: carboxymuconolactone decarboxylase family protein [Candidatus Brocadiia bacterium]
MAEVKPWYVHQSPEIGGAFADFYKAANQEGVLDKKTKELLMLALASAFRCPHCTRDHLAGAKEAGATKQEMAEALLIAAVEGAGTQLAWAKEIFREHLSGD